MLQWQALSLLLLCDLLVTAVLPICFCAPCSLCSAGPQLALVARCHCSVMATLHNIVSVSVQSSCAPLRRACKMRFCHVCATTDHNDVHVIQADADVLEGRKRLQAKWDEWRESRKDYAKELVDGQRSILEKLYDLSQMDEYSIEEVETVTQLSSNEEVIKHT